MAPRNITKVVAGMEDLAAGVGKVVQQRAGQQVVVGKIDVAYAVSSLEELSALDTSKFQRARVATSLTTFDSYVYDITATEGVQPLGAAGYWVRGGEVDITGLTEAVEKSIGSGVRIWPKDRSITIGDTVPPAASTADGLQINHLAVGDDVYAMSPVAEGVVTALGLHTATVGGVDVDLARLNKLDTFSAKAYGLDQLNNGLQNCKALQRLARAVARNKGGRVIFEHGVYTVGAQEFAGAAGKGYSYKPEDMFRLNGVDGEVYLDFQACKFEWAEGLRFGSFDPFTGDPIATTTPYLVADSRADVSWGLIDVINSKAVYATGIVEVDGRDVARFVGGKWGDKGYQCADYGLRFIGNETFHAVGSFYCHNLCLDGAYLAGGVAEGSFSKWSGLTSLYNTRQSLSLGGGNNIHIDSVVLGLTGLGALDGGASPGAGIDLEPEVYPLRGVRVTNFKILPCVGACIVGDDFDTNEVVFQDGSVSNNINTPIYTKISNIVFERVKIYGKVSPCQPGVNQNQDNNGIHNILAYPEFINCEFYNTMPDGAAAFEYPAVLSSTIAKFKDCTVHTHIPAGSVASVVIADYAQVDGLKWAVSGSIAEQTWALGYFRNHKGFKNFELINNTQTLSTPTTTARIEIGGAKRGAIFNAYIGKSSTGHENILWDNSSYAGGARSGFTQNVSSSAQQESTYEYVAEKRMSLSVNEYTSPAFYGTQDFTSRQGDSNPTTGFYRRGHVVWTKNVTANGFVGRVTTTEGTAGVTAVFKRFGQIEA